ncbi:MULTISPECIES: 30S ribosomal protein S6 [Thermotoga]|uniref:Small ribosomal subunit protein bS6 n=1 Tax=Thermotoga neapolitana (strain ATCC 49049 / DSM 4359 / NBRC 107923 / NS-E) TaxID=309803 RepID=RS6_THENN|nr:MULTISPECIES: 30S ribosomal protein S6 [Thermotoga]B9KB39.1 RecName: Full=Small ribosomal subunit protein bS6; AltName: Full=30S ribosomal protein S6 [Thermotoga neapolitana DSM 4359]ACM22235.1 30S ribosomal protein S6 [Thermotoga neapolitana DSM 4359]AJG40200.1 30S ribosomal protein S6 [Thermotoga sp. RQ7]KFZ22629.1 30S ribosomal protein S6 [Thermotoga neapolitana LA10]
MAYVKERIYESMFIIAPNVPEEEREKLVERVKGIIEERVKGKIDKVERMGMRKFAYEIKKFSEGDYTVIYFRCDGQHLQELENFYRITPEIIRWQTFRRFDLEKKERKAQSEKKEAEVSEGEGGTEA